MGIHDREYYRDETRGSLWLSGDAPACRAIIAINIVAFVLQRFIPGFIDACEVRGDQIFGHYEVWRLLTAPFLHPGPMHIAVNMLCLWFIGRELEHIYGWRDFLAFYLTAAVFSSLVWVVCDRLVGGGASADLGGASGLALPLAPGLVGASGAVLAVLVVYTLYYPRREVLFFGLIPLQVWFMLVIFLAWDVLSLMRHRDILECAAHFGGAGFGLLYKVADLRFSTVASAVERWTKQRRRPKLRIVAPEPPKPTPVARPTVAPSRSSSVASSAAPTRPAPSFAIPEEQIEEKLDAILAKIAREGKAALSDEDNRILDEVSRRFRNRRGERI